MKRFFRENGGLLVAAAVLLAALLAIGSALMGADPLTNLAQIVTTPIRSASAQVSGWVQDQYDRMARYEELEAENEELKQKLAEMEEQARAGQDALRENERLQELLGLSEERPEFSYAAGTVTRRTTTNWASNLTIDVGTAGGVSVDNCVIDQYGNLVGVITEVGANWAKVTTILDPDLEMGGRIARTDDDAIIEGDFALMLEGKLKLSFLPQDTQLVAGDQVSTSGLGGIYPGDLLVGAIESIYTEADGLTRYATLTPAADVDNIRYVYVICDFDGGV